MNSLTGHSSFTFARAGYSREFEATLYLKSNPRTDSSYFTEDTAASRAAAQTDNLLAAPNPSNQVFHNAWVCERTQVTKLISLAGDEFPQDTTHDLA